MDPWIPVTLLAALAQTVRFGLMRQLKVTRLTSTGATFARYVFVAPLAIGLALVYGWLNGLGWPKTTALFWVYVAAAGTTQILATVCVMALFARRNFSVGIAFTKTTVLMSVPVGFVLLGDTTSVLGFAAIVIGFVGVLLLSDPQGDVTRNMLRRAFNMGSALGLASGVIFAVAGVSYRGAVLEVTTGDAFFRAVFVLAIATVLQTVIMAAWMALRERGEMARVLRAWRITGLVGLTSMIGSICWFVAFSMQNVAYVNAVGQIELLFSLVVTIFIFRERISPREWQGGAVLTVSILMVILYG
ncbi:DMT family transporter [Octadecabacter ascidiaceicola]|uniref:EamA-like transporter family protein n=1 Tax=Octadecabacter ascidiaceicola TaxID=1655543 RepID=A0A238K324_9RHOB|nr:DMT family transporter [Octadecabacter ascidiaceicola]SMX37265.1 EamA-like transporter family protein [Octadecabacter ascidiaceicola]